MAYDNMTWDEPATPIIVDPVIDPNGWHWYPDSNGQLVTIYFDADGNECMMWRLQDDGSFYWRCANVGYMCREIGVEDRRGIFFENHLVGTMILDEHLTVTWLPENNDNDITINENNNYINDNINDNINYINNYINDINTIHIDYINDIADVESDDNYDP